MGPRARRRLTIGAVVLVGAAAIVAAVIVLTGSGKSAPNATGRNHEFGANADKRWVANNSKVVFGLKKQQLLKLVGPPEKIVGSCWQYRVDEIFHGFGRTSTLDRERLCFYDGRYAVEYGQWAGVWMDGSGNTVTNPTQ